MLKPEFIFWITIQATKIASYHSRNLIQYTLKEKEVHHIITLINDKKVENFSQLVE